MKILLIIFLWINSVQLFAAEQIKLSPEQLANIGVKLGQLDPVKAIPLLEAPAKVSIPPANEYLVSTAHSGLVSQINASIGDEVKKDQILAYIKSPELLTLQQQHLQSTNDLKLAKSEFSRDEKLYKEGVIADRRWRQTKTNYHVFMSHFNETRQLLEISGLSEADIKALERTRKLTSQLKITAPISGILLERMVTAGERVDLLEPLFRVAKLEKLWLDISIPQHRIQQIHLGDTVVVDDMDVTARIFLIGKHVDGKNQTVLARAEILTSQSTIRLGQTVNVKISQKSEEPMFKVPNSALAQSSGITYLFVRTDSGFNVQPVTVVGRAEQEAIIRGELQKGSEVAIKGAVALKAQFLGLGEDE